MFRSLLKHSIKSFRKQKGYVFINIIGLTLGIATSLLISLYVLNELSYDKYNEKKDRIHKLILNGKIGGQEVRVTATAAIIGPTIAKDYPEVESFCRMNSLGNTVLRHENLKLDERDFLEADSTFFNIFSIPLVYGDASKVLDEPNECVVSKTTAKKIFGNKNPVGRVLEVGTERTPYTVSGVMQDIPDNTHFDASIVASFMTNERSNDPNWLSNSFHTYLLLRENASAENLEQKLPGMIKKYLGPQLYEFMGITVDEFMEKGNKYSLVLQPLLNIHLDPTIDYLLKPSTDPKYLYIFGGIALLIILIAAINFMNLSTAKASRRAKEIGIKKAGGSTRSILIKQFLVESTIISFVSLLVAIAIVKLSLPYFNDLLDTKMTLGLLSTWYTIPALVLFTIIVGVLAGSYPAFYLSSISPYKVLRSDSVKISGHGKLRSTLVVFQFAASIILIVGTLIMYRQINYLLNKDLGFDKEQLMVMSRVSAIGNRMESFKSRVQNIPGVENISAATAVPGRNNNQNAYRLEGRLDEDLLITTNWVDYDFANTYKLEIIKGRFFDQSYPSDVDACIINQSTVTEYDLKDPLSSVILSPMSSDGLKPLKVIGVVKDFNFEALNSPVDPYIMQVRTNDFNFGYITAKLDPNNIQTTIAEVEKVWNEFTSNEPVDYFFLDEDFAQMLRQEKQSAQLSLIFAVFAIVVASLGLFGLTSYMLQQRTKEIGVRKAMGASVAQVFLLISKSISALVLVSAVIGVPLIYFVSEKWLQNYHYRIQPGLLDFLSGFVIVFIIALTTISYRTIKAASVKPAHSLRYE
ncbi:MAG: ABC transporter permease [Bacteroidales bacterium]|nr:ABC transporter permease [Bacteroidales bacterium]